MAFELDNTKLLILTGLGISWIFGGIVLSFYAIPIVVEDQIHKVPPIHILINSNRKWNHIVSIVKTRPDMNR